MGKDFGPFEEVLNSASTIRVGVYQLLNTLSSFQLAATTFSADECFLREGPQINRLTLDLFVFHQRFKQSIALKWIISRKLALGKGQYLDDNDEKQQYSDHGEQ